MAIAIATAAFAKSTASIVDNATKPAEVSRKLTKLRDTLLTELISGELRIPDAKKLAKAALS